MEGQRVGGNKWRTKLEQQKCLGGLSPLAKSLKKTRKLRQKKLTRTESLLKGLLAERDLNALFTIKDIKGKGRGVFLRAKILRKDSFVLEYEGDIISMAEAEQREKVYAHNSEGCYIMSFTFKGKKLAIDATRRFDSIARLLNHSRAPNIRFHPPLVTDLSGGLPRMASYALKDIHRGEEIVIDYGVRDGEISWLRNREIGFTENVDSDTESSDCVSTTETDDKNHVQSDITPVTMTCADSEASSSSPFSYEMSAAQFTQIKTGASIAELDKSRNDLQSNAFFGGDCALYFTRISLGGNAKTYFAGLDKIRPPQKILKSLVETPSNIREPDEESVMSVSSSGSSRKARITSCSGGENSSYKPSSKTKDSKLLPANKALDSFHKVMEWQIDSPSEDCNNGIKIVCVQSLSGLKHDITNTFDDHSNSLRQQNKPTLSNYMSLSGLEHDVTNTFDDHSSFLRQQNEPALSNHLGISATSQLPASHLGSKTSKMSQRDPPSGSYSSVLPLLSPRKMTAQEVMTVYVSDSDGSSKISYISSRVSQHNKTNVIDDLSESFMQHNKPTLTDTQGISTTKQPHVSHLDSYICKISQSDPPPSILPLLSPRKITQEIMTVDVSDSDESSNISFISDSKIESLKPNPGPELLAGSSKSPDHSDVFVVSDDECALETPVSDENLKSIYIVDLINDDGSSSSECEAAIPSEVSNLSKSEKLATHLPARRLVGFSSSSSQLQVAVIKPYVNPSAEENKQNDTAALTDSDLRHLKNIFLPNIMSGKTSPKDLQQVISENWDFINVLLDRGVSVSKIKECFQ